MNDAPVSEEADEQLDDLAAPIVLPASKRSQSTKPSAIRSIVEWLVVVGVSLGVALLIQAFLFQPFRIPSLSMYPALHNGDRIVVNKLSYKVHDVRRGDVVVFTRPDCDTKGTPIWASCISLQHLDDLVKRVVGLPGDEVFIANNTVYINGRAMEEPYVLPDTKILARPYGCGFTSTKADPYVVPDDRVFVMGDNRDDSIDSRCFGPIEIDSIVGRAFVRIWPLDHLGGL